MINLLYYNNIKAVRHNLNKSNKTYYFNDNLIYPNYTDFKDKQAGIRFYVRYMLNRCQSIFTYENLPETISSHDLELYLQCNGNCIIAEHNGDLYAFTGGLGGEPDAYYHPTIYTVSNPYLKLSKNYRIGEDCILLKNDTMLMGLLPMFSRYAALLVENELSIRVATINLRIESIITAGDSNQKTAAEKFLRDIESGELGAIVSNEFFEGITSQQYNSTSGRSVTQLIELQQYLKASWYNDIGLNANYNMKRESINTHEAQLNNDSLLPLIDDMLKQRQEGLDAVNSMFGTNITVDLNSSWKIREEENNAMLEVLEETPEVALGGKAIDTENDMTENKEIENKKPENDEPESKELENDETEKQESENEETENKESENDETDKENDKSESDKKEDDDDDDKK